MLQFKSRFEMEAGRMSKANLPFLTQKISGVNFKSKYISDKFDGVQTKPQVKSSYEFKDISNDKETD